MGPASVHQRLIETVSITMSERYTPGVSGSQNLTDFDYISILKIYDEGDKVLSCLSAAAKSDC